MTSLFTTDAPHSKKIGVILHHDLQPTGNSKVRAEEEYLQRGNSWKGARWVSSACMKSSSSLFLFLGQLKSHRAALHCTQLQTWISTPRLPLTIKGRVGISQWACPGGGNTAYLAKPRYRASPAFLSSAACSLWQPIYQSHSSSACSRLSPAAHTLPIRSPACSSNCLSY